MGRSERRRTPERTNAEQVWLSGPSCGGAFTSSRRQRNLTAARVRIFRIPALVTPRSRPRPVAPLPSPLPLKHPTYYYSPVILLTSRPQTVTPPCAETCVSSSSATVRYPHRASRAEAHELRPPGVRRGCRKEYHRHVPHQGILRAACASAPKARFFPGHLTPRARSNPVLPAQVQHIVPEVTIPPEVTPENVTTYIVDSGSAFLLRVSRKPSLEFCVLTPHMCRSLPDSYCGGAAQVDQMTVIT